MCYTDQTTGSGTGNVWRPPVRGDCREKNGERAAYPNGACEAATGLAENVWIPQANTACEDRVPDYCRQHSLDLAATETIQLEHELDHNSLANQLWREVPRFAFICGAVVLGYMLCRCAIAVAQFRHRREREGKTKEASPPATPPGGRALAPGWLAGAAAD